MSYYDGKRSKRKGKKTEAIVAAVVGIGITLFICLIVALFAFDKTA